MAGRVREMKFFMIRLFSFLQSDTKRAVEGKIPRLMFKIVLWSGSSTYLE